MIINENLSLNTRFFKIGVNTYEIIETKSNSTLRDTIDIVRNNETKVKKHYKRADLKIMLDKYNAKKHEEKTRI